MSPKRSILRAALIQILIPAYLLAIAGVPLLLAVAGVWTSHGFVTRSLAAVAAPAVYVLGYLLIAGALSRLTLRRIVQGKFHRDLGDRVYGPRRLYALCWTAICYAPPIYHAMLALPWLKRAVFRLFGYRGSLEFQTYPDTWLRDLPLLTVGKGAYLSNKATVSPNMCLRNGKILILPVSIGSGVMVGHLTMIAPGVEIGAESEIGVGAALGINACVGRKTVIDHEVILDHDATIGNNCVVGTRAYVGRRAVVRDGLRIPPAAVIPARSVLSTQDEVDALCGVSGAARRRSTLATDVEDEAFDPAVIRSPGYQNTH